MKRRVNPCRVIKIFDVERTKYAERTVSVCAYRELPVRLARSYVSLSLSLSLSLLYHSTQNQNMCRDEIDCHALGMMYADEVSVLRDHVSASDLFDQEGHLKCAGRSLECGAYCDMQTCCRMPNECDNITSANCSTSASIWCPHKCDRNSSSSCTETDLGENLDVPHRKSWVRGRILNPYCTASSTESTLKDRLSIWYVFAASSSFSRAH